MAQLLSLEAFYNFVLTMILEATRSAHPNHPALHFQFQHTPVEKRPLKIYVTRKRLQSRKIGNGLLRKYLLAYDKAMKLKDRITDLKNVAGAFVVTIPAYLFNRMFADWMTEETEQKLKELEERRNSRTNGWTL